jgi:hypothetical protein
MISPRTWPLVLGLLVGCATAGSAKDVPVKVVIVQTTPARGSKIEADTIIRVVADYAVDRLDGQGRISVVFRTSGGYWEPAKQQLSQRQGRVTFEVPGKDLLNHPSVLHPPAMQVVVEMVDGRQRTLHASDVLAFATDRRLFKFLPPGVGKAQLISDMVNDPRYRPPLPAELSVRGSVYWGLFTICVDAAGGVVHVKQLRLVHPLLDGPWQSVLLGLRYRPYLVDGQAVPFCYPMRLEVTTVAR